MLGRHHEGRGRATPIFKIPLLFRKLLQEDKYFSVIIFIVQNIFEILPSMVIDLKWRDRATPIFR